MNIVSSAYSETLFTHVQDFGPEKWDTFHLSSHPLRVHMIVSYDYTLVYFSDAPLGAITNHRVYGPLGALHYL